MSIKLNTNRRTVRETTADFEYTDDKGKLKVEKIQVLYYSPTIKESKALREEMRSRAATDPDDIWWYSESLARTLHALPDLINPDTGKPYDVTAELLESIDTKNLEAIQIAINEDIRAGKSPEPA